MLSVATGREDTLVDLRELLLGLVVAVENLLVMVGGGGVSRAACSWSLGAWFRFGLRRGRRGGRDGIAFGDVVVDAKALSVELVVHAEQVASVVDVVAWGAQVRASLDRALGDVQIVAEL